MTNLSKFNSLNLAYQRVITDKAEEKVAALSQTTTYGKWATENKDELLDKYKEYYSYLSNEELYKMLLKESEQLTVPLSQKQKQEKITHLARNMDLYLETTSHMVVNSIKAKDKND